MYILVYCLADEAIGRAKIKHCPTRSAPEYCGLVQRIAFWLLSFFYLLSPISLVTSANSKNICVFLLHRHPSFTKSIEILL